MEIDTATLLAFFTGLSGLVTAILTAGNRAAQIKKLTTRVTELETTIELLQEALNKERLLNLSLQNRIDALEKENERLTTELNQLKKRRGF